MNSAYAPAPRVLVIDDTPSIHQDFRRLLSVGEGDTSLADLRTTLFGTHPPRPKGYRFEVDSAFQGEEGLQRVGAALKEGRPYALAFVDVRMPPGMDGVETTERLWREDPDLQVVLCSAHTDYSWEQVVQRLGISQRLLILHKPFDSIEVRQMAHALAEKWELLRRDRRRLVELEQANARLRLETEERMRLEHQLAQAQKLEALGRLAAGLAHEVNNPLSFIIANLNHVQRELGGLAATHPTGNVEELQESCHDALHGCERIQRLVQDVRGFSRGRSCPAAPVNVDVVLEDALAMANLAQVPGLQVERELCPVPPILADEHGLGQVFLNLLINALHAVANGPAEPRIRVASGLHEDGRVWVEVQDNGRGIAPENLGRIFEPFFTTKPVGVGTGLGLFICHGIITGFGGELSVESQPGQGATFRVLLPAAPPHHVGVPSRAVA
ncbi:hybrid sensor histidine kinase/response regulator [Archangium sp.]|uniref:hybrid sensor histidine kinase/response regulator n=1 Tax=Archangium sp. TaxID=1872627 RepID=UPI002D417EFA|nr:ATP-binding protein [Archangium sp.]HYO55577.1 ATP-binding protein [Archangium sp.]